MGRFLFLALAATLLCCNGKDDAKDGETPEGTNFSTRFKTGTLPYSLSDTALLNNRDTATVRSAAFAAFVPDSVKTIVFGKGAKVKYVPIAAFNGADGESYYITKAVSGSRRAALLVTVNKDKSSGVSLPFLTPDSDPATSQVSTIDKAFSVSRNITRKGKDDVMTEGKEVFAYNAETRQFTLIMTDVLDDRVRDLINPVDTFPRKSKWAGDYLKGKRNIVSVRDGRNPNEVEFFVHFENADGDCTGELRGTALMTSTSRAVYRQGGDPCVLEFNFSPAAVALREAEGCGSHRGVKCVFEGSFSRKKEPKSKTAKSTTPKKKR